MNEMSVYIPTLQTPRLTLCGYQPGDLDDAFAMWSSPEVTRHIGGKPFSREEVWARLLRYVGHWSVAGYGFWQLRERATDRFVGEVGIADFKREISVSFDGAPEAGWALAPWAHGQGFASEAITAMLEWAASEGHLRIVCIIDVSNTTSLRAAARCGFRRFAQTDYKGSDVIVHERLHSAPSGSPA